jgi:hypothetical protein
MGTVVVGARPSVLTQMNDHPAALAGTFRSTRIAPFAADLQATSELNLPTS